MRIDVKPLGKLEDQENVYRYQVLVNRKNQGNVLNHNLAKDNNFWQIENDKTNKRYSSKDEVVKAICAKNGRKLKE